jgi:hypothetical protein
LNLEAGRVRLLVSKFHICLSFFECGKKSSSKWRFWLRLLTHSIFNIFYENHRQKFVCIFSQGKFTGKA